MASEVGNVVGLRGEEVPSFDPNLDVVAIAEDILQYAKSGEIQCLVAIWVHKDATVGSKSRGTVTYRLLGLMTKIMSDFCAAAE